MKYYAVSSGNMNARYGPQYIQAENEQDAIRRARSSGCTVGLSFSAREVSDHEIQQALSSRNDE